jgi:hypothetical protein
MEIFILNGSPIAFAKTNFQLTEEEKKYILSLEMYKNEGNASLSKNVSVLQSKTLERIEEILNKYTEKYKKDVLEIEDSIKVVQSWITLNNNTNHHYHRHQNAFISAVLYLENTGDNSIAFETDKSSIEKCQFLDFKIKKYNWFNSSTWRLKIEEGMIVIFLGDLIHSSVNKGKKTMIGANYFLTGKIGSESKLTQLTL